MLPVFTLGEGRVAVGRLQARIMDKMERLQRLGFVIIIGLFLFIPLVAEIFGIVFNIFCWLIGASSEYRMKTIFNKLD